MSFLYNGTRIPLGSSCNRLKLSVFFSGFCCNNILYLSFPHFTGVRLNPIEQNFPCVCMFLYCFHDCFNKRDEIQQICLFSIFPLFKVRYVHVDFPCVDQDELEA